METVEPKHYVRVCVARELTNKEFEEMTDIIHEGIADLVMSDNVIEYKNEQGLMCYMFDLCQDIVDTPARDIIEFEMDQVIPQKLQWGLEVSNRDGQQWYINSTEIR